MSRISRRRTYEGRALARPDDEVVDQGLAFDLGTLATRRRVLALFGAGAGAAGAGIMMRGAGVFAATTPVGSGSGSGSGSAPATEIPDETAGPYPGDGSNGPDVLEQSGIVRSDITTSFGEFSGTAEGVPMTLELTIHDLANGGVPYEGVAVYAWHCTREGLYSLYSQGVTDQNYLRGVQITDADGKVTFTSIFPACYSGRWPHVHFEVYPDEAAITDSTNAIATSQVALPEDVCNEVYATEGYEQSITTLSRVTLASDNVFGDDGGASQLATVTGDATTGYVVALAVGIDATTEPTGGGMPGAGMPGGGMPGGGMPGGGMPGGPPPEGGPGSNA